MARTLTTLPEELILRVFSHLHRLDDLYSLTLTNKLFRRISHDVSPADISRLALNTGNFLPGLRPYQHTLLIPSARRLADWAIQSKERRDKLASAMLSGIDGLVAIAMEEAPITLDDIRKTWRWKQAVLDPLSQEMDGICGRPSQPDDFLTVCEDPSLTLLMWAIYGELFHHSFSYLYSWHDPDHPTPFDSIMRFKFMVYCMPDVNAFTYMGLERPAWFESMAKTADRFQQLGLNHATREFLLPSLWVQAIREVMPGVLDDNGDEGWGFEYLTKDRLLVTAVSGSGVQALDLLQATRSTTECKVEPPQHLVRWVHELHQKIDRLPLDESETGEISCGTPYDPWLEQNWVTLPWDQQTTLWDAGPYSLREKVYEEHAQKEAWDATRRAIGEDPLAPSTASID
ncbi:hypothetical protein M409DRAFT_51427 [Zasmidium cellare ATCC 36951]|uniref:F-box domain-containing protein n=1 Tax=Zasmidium cellare ATCC 36951 TaxID=1080233 RepID=A0A6A6CVZ8_ZASCE|nr:uncharacterized protein M409DRAFT_51427 [Zasmidium cellare ATCC 36951]KAF2170378.1 hypothetical protein M409DRAFT_51427 [Zasmidium cellare ATCC 36951]